MKRSAFFILSLILFLNIFAPIAQAATDTYRPTLDESGQCVHGSLAGDYDDYGWSIFIGNDQFDTAAGIRFPNITIDQAEIINDANLTVYYPGGFDWNTGTLYLMIYGYDADDAPRDLTWSDIVNGPRTEALTVFNMSLMNITGSYVIDVTDHVQEIINRYNWESGNAIAFTTLHILEDDAGEYWYEWASNTGAYKNHRPSLTVRHGEAEAGPEGEWEFIEQYKGYDIYKGALGIRTLIFEDASGDDWIIASTNGTGTWTTYNNSLPFNVDIEPNIQDTVIVIDDDIWCLGGTGNTLNLYRSQDFGENWDTMQGFNIGHDLDAYKMEYSETSNIIYIGGYNDDSIESYFMSYDITSDSEDISPYEFHQGQHSISDIDFAIDENDNIWWGQTGGGSWGSETRLMARKRVDGVWSSKEYFDDAWAFVEVQVSTETPNNNKTISYLVANGEVIYLDRLNINDPLGELDFNSGEWGEGGTGNTVRMCRQNVVTPSQFNSAIRPMPDDPYDAYYQVATVYYDLISETSRTCGSMSGFPYPNVFNFDNANYSSHHWYHAIYLDVDGQFRIYTQDTNSRDHIYEMSLNWLEKPGTFIYLESVWDARKVIQHHENINSGYWTVATEPFGDQYWLIYKNGTIIKTLPVDENNETDIKDWIDDERFNITDPENPAAGGRWTGLEPWYINRQHTQLYFSFIGLMCIIPPWIIAAQKRRIDIVVTAIFLNLIGIALLYGMSYI